MTDTTTLEATSGTSPRRSGALTAMRLAELQGLASSMGISGTAKMRKGDLVAAIKARQNGESGPASAGEPRREQGQPRERHEPGSAVREEPAGRSDRRDRTDGSDRPDRDRAPRDDRNEQRGDVRDRADRADRRDRVDALERGDQRDHAEDTRDRAERQERTERQQNQQAPGLATSGQGQQGQNRPAVDDDEGRGGRRRRNRGRNRDKRRTPGAPGVDQVEETQPQIAEDDVLVPVAGILDILDNYAFVRTTGYLPGASDIYVPLQMVKRNNLRKGDAVTGSIKAAREGEEQQQ
ncbi:MAG TPA: Rho termination factor N-terminal domain-containing protein, partial [Ornithinibacter sp.]|nr:Rho termination factor N-terminal domain-containing protein [Ornithinibacter sp.]